MQQKQLTELQQTLHAQLAGKYPKLVYGSGSRLTPGDPVIHIFVFSSAQGLHEEVDKGYCGCRVELESPGTFFARA